MLLTVRAAAQAEFGDFGWNFSAGLSLRQTFNEPRARYGAALPRHVWNDKNFTTLKKLTSWAIGEDEAIRYFHNLELSRTSVAFDHQLLVIGLPFDNGKF